MKDIVSLWLWHTLVILLLKHISKCHADDPSESDHLARSNYEDPNSNNRRGYYGEPDNVNRANQYYEEAYDDAARRTSQYETKFTKTANLRKPPYLELRKAYDTALGYGNTRNGVSSEIEITTVGTTSAEKDDSNGSIIHEGGLANSTVFGSVTALVKSNFPKPSTDSCTCQGSGANEEVSFLCFSSKDGSKNLSIKYKGVAMFKLEDIIKAYKFYYDNMKIHNFNFENILNSESNFKHEYEGENKFNFDISKFKINEGSFNFNAESNFDINELKKGDNKFKGNTFDKFDVNAIKEDSNKFNFDITENGDQDIQKYYFNDNTNFKTQFDKNINSNFNLESNSKMEAWKKIQELAESKKNNKFSFDNNFSSNQFTFESDVQADAQAEVEAHAKALAEAKAIKNAQAILEAQVQLQAEAKAQAFLQAQAEAKAQAFLKAQAEAEAQAVMQNQIIAQAEAEAQAKSKAEALAKGQALVQQNAQSQSQVYGIGQTHVNTQSHAFSFSDGNNNGHLNNAVNLGGGGEKKIFGNGFSLGFNGAFGASKSGTSYGKQAGGAFSFGGGGSGAIGLGVGGGGAISLGGGGSGASHLGVGGGGAIGMGGRVPFSGKPGMGAVVAYTGGELNYGDDMYDESADDGYQSTSYPGVLAFPAPSTNSGGRLYNKGKHQKDGFAAFGVSGYQRYP